jgi:hypothetical protein
VYFGESTILQGGRRRCIRSRKTTGPQANWLDRRGHATQISRAGRRVAWTARLLYSGGKRGLVTAIARDPAEIMYAL